MDSSVNRQTTEEKIAEELKAKIMMRNKLLKKNDVFVNDQKENKDEKKRQIAERREKQAREVVSKKAVANINNKAERDKEELFKKMDDDRDKILSTIKSELSAEREMMKELMSNLIGTIVKKDNVEKEDNKNDKALEDDLKVDQKAAITIIDADDNEENIVSENKDDSEINELHIEKIKSLKTNDKDTNDKREDDDKKEIDRLREEIIRNRVTINEMTEQINTLKCNFDGMVQFVNGLSSKLNTKSNKSEEMAMKRLINMIAKDSVIKRKATDEAKIEKEKEPVKQVNEAKPTYSIMTKQNIVKKDEKEDKTAEPNMNIEEGFRFQQKRGMNKKRINKREEIKEDTKKKIEQDYEKGLDEEKVKKNVINLEEKKKLTEAIMDENSRTIGFLQDSDKATKTLIDAMIERGTIKKEEDIDSKKKKAVEAIVKLFVTKNIGMDINEWEEMKVEKMYLEKKYNKKGIEVEVIYVRFHNRENVNRIKSKLSKVDQDTNDRVTEFIHPASRERWRYFNHAAWQIRKEENKKAKVLVGREDFKLIVKEKEDKTRWGDIAPIWVEGNIPEFNIGQLSEEDKKEEDAEKERKKKRMNDINEKIDKEKKREKIENLKEEERLNKLIEEWKREEDNKVKKIERPVRCEHDNLTKECEECKLDMESIEEHMALGQSTPNNSKMEEDSFSSQNGQ